MEIKLDETGAFPIARLSGRFSAADSERFERTLHPYVAQRGAKLAVDLSNVEYIESSGLSSLINLVARARLAEGHVVLIGPTRQVSGVFEVAQLDTWFEIFENKEEAAASFA
jgi:anti-sigma B factor antagonist